MSNDRKHCGECGNLMHSNIGCINPRCKNHKSCAALTKTLETVPPASDADLSLDTMSPPPPPSISEPPTGNVPTGDLPPERQALYGYLSSPDRDPWPDLGQCQKEGCRRSLNVDFLFCPLCGTKREQPESMQQATKRAYAASIKPMAIGSSKPPSETNLPASGNLMPPPRNAIRPPEETTYRHTAPHQDQPVFPGSTKKPRR